MTCTRTPARESAPASNSSSGSGSGLCTQVASAIEELDKSDNVLRYAARVAAPAGEDPGPTEEQENPPGIPPPGDLPKPEEEIPGD